jgi:TPR repeat protein
MTAMRNSPLAVINNDIEAAYQLAELYVLGRGADKDVERAQELYARVAEIDWKDSKERPRQVEDALAKSR